MSLRVFVVSLMLVGFAPSVARADGLIVPFYGVNFGGDSGQSISTAFEANQSNWGVSFAFMGAGVLGLETDFGYSPEFFGKTDSSGSSMLSATANILIGVPLGGQQGFGIRPYGVVGVGVVHSQVDSFQSIVGFEHTEGAWDAGGGVMMFFTSHVGVRGDYRFFRTFTAVDLIGISIGEPDNMDYSRGSLGLILRF